MFNALAPVYDRGNRVLSFGLDIIWRRIAVCSLKQPQKVLDLACGTGDFAKLVAMQYPEAQVIGVDFAPEMVALAQKKIPSNKAQFKVANAEDLPFQPETFDAVTVGWGMRNFLDRTKVLCEIKRVTRPGGQLVILEAARPESFLQKVGYSLYWWFAIPVMSVLFFQNRQSYHYLKQSMSAMPNGEAFLKELELAGFQHAKCRYFGLGMCSLFTAVREQ